MSMPTPGALLPEAIVLLAHGSRDPAWREPIEAVASRLRERPHAPPVRCAYLELTEPSLQDVVEAWHATGLRRLRVLPLFLGLGAHARRDIPAQVHALQARLPGLVIELLPAAGLQAGVQEALAQLAWPAQPSPDGRCSSRTRHGAP